MIVAHHGAELPVALATLVGTVPPLLVLVRARLTGTSARFRRQTRQK